MCAAKVVVDRPTGKSKGFGFVTYANIEDAERAREGMNSKFLDGWVIFVDPAKPREPRPPPQHESQPQQSGFTVNKTVGWCGQWKPAYISQLGNQLKRYIDKVLKHY